MTWHEQSRTAIPPIQVDSVHNPLHHKRKNHPIYRSAWPSPLCHASLAKPATFYHAPGDQKASWRGSWSTCTILHGPNMSEDLFLDLLPSMSWVDSMFANACSSSMKLRHKPSQHLTTVDSSKSFFESRSAQLSKNSLNSSTQIDLPLIVTNDMTAASPALVDLPPPHRHGASQSTRQRAEDPPIPSQRCKRSKKGWLKNWWFLIQKWSISTCFTHIICIVNLTRFCLLVMQCILRVQTSREEVHCEINLFQTNCLHQQFQHVEGQSMHLRDCGFMNHWRCCKWATLTPHVDHV